ncbi:MAG TPA: hypothetical protein VM911_12625 [Pyrinomonadaceae bacterium]|jgi:hypothetical protein|nr:hypothetical protein [Pyrinomonadaceae bacterium]
MRYLRQFCAVTMLVCALAFSAYAGNIECPAVTSTPPQATGEMQYGITDTLILLIVALV